MSSYPVKVTELETHFTLAACTMPNFLQCKLFGSRESYPGLVFLPNGYLLRFLLHKDAKILSCAPCLRELECMSVTLADT